MSDDLEVLGPDGIRRTYDEHYDTMMDVEQDPTGAWQAIQKQHSRIEELEANLAKAVTRLQHIAANKTTDELTVIEWDTYDMFTILNACISEARTTLAELTSSEAAYGEAKGGKDE